MLARGRGGFDFELVGLLELKGLPEPVAACSVRVGAPHASSTHALALPPELVGRRDAPFVGRDDEAPPRDRVHARQPRRRRRSGCSASPASARRASRPKSRRAPTPRARSCLRPLRRTGARTVPAGHRRAALVRRPPARRGPAGAARDRSRAARPPRARAARRGSPTCRSPEGRDRERAVPPVRVGAVVPRRDRGRASRSCSSSTTRIGPTGRRSRCSATSPRHAQPAHLTIIATARDTDPDISDPLTDLIDDLERTGRSRRFELRGLSTDDIVTLVEAAALSRPTRRSSPRNSPRRPPATRCSSARCSRASTPDGSLPTRAARPTCAPRCGAGSAASNPARRSCCKSRRSSASSSRSTSRATRRALDESEGLTRVEQAVHAGLVEEIGIDRFRFTHALVRDALETELSASRGARVHAAIAASIETRFAGRLDDHLHALAHHYAAAGIAARSLERAIDYAAAPGAAPSTCSRSTPRPRTTRSRSRSSTRSATQSCAAAIRAADGEGRRRAPRRHAPGRARDVLGGGRPRTRENRTGPRFTRAVLAYEEANWRPGLARPHLGRADPRSAGTRARSGARGSGCEPACARALHYSGDHDATAGRRRGAASPPAGSATDS